MIESFRDAASATTYRGFSAVDARRDGPPRPPPSRRSAALPLALGAAAVAGGLAWFLTGADRTPTPPPLRPAAATSLRTYSTATTLRAEPALAPAPAEQVRGVERLPHPVLPRMLRVERLPAPAVAPAPVRHAPARKAFPVRRAAAPVRLNTKAAPGRALFHCDWRLRRSERMVCGDARLTQLDRELNHAYGAAVRAGAPRDQLRRAQDAWVMRREGAARSPATLAAYYQRRIRQLDAMARRPR